MHDKFREIGEQLFALGLNGTHSGNLSLRDGDRIHITRTGSRLHKLGPGDIVTVGLTPDAARDAGASMELLNHRAIYAADPAAGAVVHAHGPCAVAQAHGRERIAPYDEEGRYYFAAIPVIAVEKAVASPQVAAALGPLAARVRAAVVARHGIFAWGADLEEALKLAVVVESSCRILQLLEDRRGL